MDDERHPLEAPEPPEAAVWQPATSEPFELYGFEGEHRIRATFLAGLKNRDPRRKQYRRSMQLVVLGLLAAMIVVVALAMIV
jgi:hypothetical protein